MLFRAYLFMLFCLSIQVLAEAHSANLPMGLNEACDIICIFADGGRTDLALEVKISGDKVQV